MSKYALLIAFAERRPVTVKGIKFAVINKLEHEDGSGRSFNVTGIVNGVNKTVYVRTTD